MNRLKDLRDAAVGLTGQTVIRSIEVFPHCVLVLFHPTGTALNTHVSILKVHTLLTLIRTLHKKHI